MSVVDEVVGGANAAVIATGSLLEGVARQAARADRTRTVDPAVVDQIKRSPLLALGASKELGGGEETVAGIAAELEALASACGSTAWCVWNHLSIFHLFCGALGPDHAPLLASIVEAGEWVCFPGGASSRVFGRVEGDVAVLEGPAAFGSGCRYAEWAGVAFALGGGSSPVKADDLRFSIVRLDSPGVRIEETWDGTAVRASATDTIHYEGAPVPLDRCVRWYAANRAEALRDPSVPMIHHRYREDWVGVSDLWLGAMAVGVVTAALDEAVSGIRGRKALMGAAMEGFVTVQANLGHVAALLSTARRAVLEACAEVDQRIAEEVLPTEADYQRQAAVTAVVLRLCEDAMGLLLRTLGGNGLREGAPFERRWRDLAAFGVHINAHPDRVYPRLGQLLLGLPLNRF